jgi:hypothetical protein
MPTMNTKATYLLLAAFCVPFATAQSSSQKPVKGMASTVGLYVYPQKQQSATQQLTDEQQCYGSAKTQTGFDPNATTTAAKTTKPSSGNDHAAAKGAMRGATISGAVGGDPGHGAARGAILGSVRAKRKAKEQSEQAEKKADATKTPQQQKQDDFKRAMSACLDARGYSVR